MKKKLYQHIVPSTNQLLAFIKQADNAVSFSNYVFSLMLRIWNP